MQQRVRLAAIVMGVAVLCLPACSARKKPPTATVVEYGRYDATVVGLPPADDVSGGVQVATRDRQHVETTKSIQGKIGQTWGFRVRWENLPSRAYEFRTEL